MTWALIVIDSQAWPSHNAPAHAERVEGKLRSLVRAFKAAGEAVFFVESEMADQSQRVEVASNRETVYRCGTDAFAGTGLKRRLRDRAISCVVICGVGTDTAIEASVRGALYLGLDVILASDAHLAFDRQALSAMQITEHHNQLMGELLVPGQVVEVIPCSEILAILHDEPLVAAA